MKRALYALALIASPASAEPYGPDLMALRDIPTPTPARDERWKKWEVAFQVANAADFAGTAYCLSVDRCTEGNPLYGSNPSTAKLLAIKAGTGALHYWLVSEIAKTDPGTARVVAMVSTFVIGGVAIANLRVLF